MAAFDILAYMQTFEAMLRISEQAWLLDEDFLNVLEKLDRVLGVTNTEIQIGDHDDMEVITLYQDRGVIAAGCSEHEFTADGKNVRCLMFTRLANGDYTAELKAGLNASYEIVRMLVTRELDRRREEAQKQIDYVTGVSTKALFTEYADALFQNGDICSYVACGFSLKSMAELNRQVGNDNGNKLMAAYVRDLQALLGNKGMVARTGGINFSVIFPKDRFDEVAIYLSGKAVSWGEDTEGRMMSATAGFYFISENCQGAEELNDIIAAALHNALQNPGQQFIIYDEKLQQADKDAKYIAEIFQDALENEEFFVFYQPKVELNKYRLKGAEALCRWKHDGQMVLPYRFIPVLESNGDIVKLDFYMLERVCRDLRRWIDEGRATVRVSINLSRCHLGDPNLLQHIIEIVDRYEVPHRLVEIELTETTTEVDYQELKGLVAGLREQGIATSVDDFGVGYSSMNLLYEMPWSMIKIDRSFIPMGNGGAEDEKRTVMLKSIISMVQSLGLESVAEGVETIDQIVLLKESRCYFVQGYYFDKPLPVEEFEKRLELLKAAE